MNDLTAGGAGCEYGIVSDFPESKRVIGRENTPDQ